LKKILYLSIFSLTWSCQPRQIESNYNDVEYQAQIGRSILDTTQNLTLFRDYDPFERRGIEKLERGKVKVPFIQIFSRTDSVIILRIFEDNLEDYEEALIPAVDGIELTKSYDFTDNPNVIFGKISGKQIIRYGYLNSNPYDLDKKDSSVYLHEIIPYTIEIISRDTIKSLNYFQYVHDRFGMDINDNGPFKVMASKIVFPFRASINYEKDFSKLSKILYWTVITETDSTLIYQSYIKDINSVTKGRPIVVLRKFRYWRTHLNPARSM
jgi:hypothetical protein